MTTVNWLAFDWQSFATLTTGISAVVGATIVGSRQVGITRRQAAIAEAQNAILARQVEIEAQKLQADLFERRLATFEVTSDFILDARSYYNHPNAAVRVKFYAKLRESRFLFRSEVFEGLDQIAQKAQGLWHALEAIESDKAHGFPHDAKNQGLAAQHSSWLLMRLGTLHELFGPDLWLVRAEQPETPALASSSDSPYVP